MRNILLFGPPASGKLSIATAIAQKGQHVVVDNHRTIDAANLINKNQAAKIPDLAEKLRECLYAATDVSIVATVVYAAGIDDALIEKYREWLSRTNGPSLLVQLHCPQKIVKDRCSQDSRSGTSKITDPLVIDNLYSKYDFDTRHPSTQVIHLSTKKYSIHQAADIIYKHAEQGGQPDAFGAGYL